MAATVPHAMRGNRSGTRSSRFRARRYATKKYAAARGPIAAERRKGVPPGIRSRRRESARRYSGADKTARYLKRFNEEYTRLWFVGEGHSSNRSTDNLQECPSKAPAP